MSGTQLRAVAITGGISALALGITACGSGNSATVGHSMTSTPRLANAPTTAAAPAPPAQPRLRLVAPRPDARVAPNVTIRVSLTGVGAVGSRALRYVLDGGLTRFGSARLTFLGLAPGEHHLVVALASRPTVRARVSFTVPVPAATASPSQAPTPASSAPTPLAPPPPPAPSTTQASPSAPPSASRGGIPQGPNAGDADADNSGGPSDGDGNI